MMSASQAKSNDTMKPLNGSQDLASLIAQRIESLDIADLAELMRLHEANDIIGIDAAAAELMVHPVTLRKQAKAWGVPHKRLGTEWRFSRKRLREWMQSGGKAA